MTARKLALVVLPGGGSSAPAGTIPPPERDDDQLMLLASGGHRPAFDELVRRHRGRLLGVAIRYVKSPGLARDVTQNTFLEVYRAAQRYEPRGSFTSFLYRALLNQCRMARRAALSEERLLAAATAAAGAGSDLDEDTAEQRILARERERRVQAALDRLSEKLRALVVLRYSGDLSYQEIADVLDIPLGTVKRRLFDALEKLRELLPEEP
jgi:RNA polymerase sigma-70 factor (ECF subfamily)